MSSPAAGATPGWLWESALTETKAHKRDVVAALRAEREANTKRLIAEFRARHPDATARDGVIAILAELEILYGKPKGEQGHG